MSAVSNALRQLDDASWSIAGRLFLHRKPFPDASALASWGDGNGGFFVLSAASAPPSETHPLPDTSEIRQVYDAGDVSAVWRVGEAFVKLHAMTAPDATREHTTLEYLRARQPLGFRIPEVYHHADLGNWYLIVVGRAAGRTLSELWYEMGEADRGMCVGSVARICRTLASWTGEAVAGVDGKQLAEPYLLRSDAAADFDPAHLRRNCEEIGMDCSYLGFYHCDLGPGNILFDEDDGSITIIDWEVAGYVPGEWIRTKFRVSSGLDLPTRDGGDVPITDWRRRVSQELERLGYSDVAEKWMEWHFTK